MGKKYFFIRDSTCMATCLIRIPHLFHLSSAFPSLSPVTSLRRPPLENVTVAILSYSVSHLHEGTGKLRKTLCWYSRPFNRVCPQSNSLWKMTSRSAFRCAGRGPVVTHPSTDPAKICLTWVIAWHRTPTTHRTLSVGEKVLSVFFMFFKANLFI